MAAHLRPGACVLDIGCGTGEDALWLARQGFEVHAIDESPKMIAVAKAKASENGSTARFACRTLASLGEEEETFDAVISNFGALNCAPLSDWTKLVPRLLAVGGRAFLALMSRSPLPEGLRRGFRPDATRRTGKVRLGAAWVSAHYPSVLAVRQAIGSAFEVKVEALGCLVPGPGFSGFARRHPLALGLLAAGEVLVRRAPFFSGRGDHTLFEVSRA